MVSSVNTNLNSLFASFSDVTKVTAPQAQFPVDPVKRVTTTPEREALNEAAQRQQGRNRQAADRFGLPEERQATFASFTRPRPVMAPAEEMALFAQAADAPVQVTAPQSPDRSAELTQPPAASPVVLRRQSYVANLYAQANDVVFSGDRSLNQAA